LVTGSYHAAVFALSMGVPVVALVASSYYENKFTGVAAQFGGGCRVVDLRGEWRDALTCAVEDAWNAGVSRREALLAAAWRQVAAAEEGYERLFSVVASAGSGNHGDQPAVRRWR
jgi:polysaccharide pyruvyl transferase WcaK-like protein